MSVTQVARELGTTDRTLRRLAKVGTIRSGRAGERLRRSLPREQSYLRQHWELLSRLRSALRTEPKVLAALIFGSVATGSDTPSSDVDLIVALDGTVGLAELHRLGRRLTSKVGRRVDLFNLDDLMAEPERLGAIVDEARPVVDRAYVWPQLVAARRRLRRRASVPRRRPWRAAMRGIRA